MLLNCINPFGQTKLVVQSIMHMKIYGKTDKKWKKTKNNSLNKHVGKVNLAYWLWHECPCHKQSNILWKELSVCTCISKRRKWKRSIRQTVLCVHGIAAKAHKIHYCNNLSSAIHSFWNAVRLQETSSSLSQFTLYPWSVRAVVGARARFRFSFFLPTIVIIAQCCGGNEISCLMSVHMLPHTELMLMLMW